MARLIALLALTAIVALTAAAPANARARCAVKHSHTVAKNRLVRVYYVRPRGDRLLYGCRRATGRKRLVAAEYDDGYVESGSYRDVRLAGRFVAAVLETTDVSCKAACPPDYEATLTTVVIRNMGPGRSQVVHTRAQPGSLRLSASGVAAWLDPVAGGSALQVIDGAGFRALDSGAIDPASLALAGLHLTWANAGAPRSAELTPL